MSIVKRTAKTSPRIIAIGLLITLLSTFGLAYSLDSVKTFTQLVGASFALGQTDNRGGQTEITTSKQEVVNNKAALGALSGTYNIPGDYADLATAITDLNASGVSGPVIFNVIAGNPQTSPANVGTTGGGYIIGGTGSLVLTTTSSTNTVTIQGNGNTITAPATHIVGQLNDGIFKIIGADWITITGFSMQENALNTVTAAATNNMTEWGVALLYVTATDGAQNNTITGNTIDLNRTYQNTFGIYSNSTHTNTSVTTSATATGAAGSNAPLTITANNITDVNFGIMVIGPTAAADNNDGLMIGGTAPNANTITNYGTTNSFSSYVNIGTTGVSGVWVRNTKNYNVSFNSITSSSGASGITASTTARGIYVAAASNQPTGTFTNNINNNTVAVTTHVVAGAIIGIAVDSTTSSPTSTTNINNNNFTTLNHTIAAATGAITAISQSGSATAGPLVTSVSNNTFTNITSSSTGSFTFISNSFTSPAAGTKNVNSNSIVTAFNKTGAGGTVIFFTDNGSDPGASNTNNFNSNIISNITVTGATAVTAISSTNGGAPTKNVLNNTVSNISGGTGAVIGISTGFDAGPTTITGNNVNTLSGGGAVTGMTHATGAGVRTIGKNKIYDLNGTAAASIVIGIGITSTSASSNITVSNNLIGNLTAGAATSANGIRGIDITGSATTATFNVFYNTVYLNNTTSGAGFGSSGVSTLASSTATTSTLNMRNNIIVNTSVQNGAGLTVAYRRSTGTAGTLANYASTSNNNLFYAGTPSATNLIYSDGTSTAMTIAAYKNGVFTAGTISPRDSNSVSENPPFLSTTGSSANFLHINTTIATQVESGGTPVSGITDDYDGDTRNVSTPDIGADEFTGIPLDIVGPAISYTPFGNTTQTTNRNLTVTITDASGVAGGAFAPRIYFRKNGGSYVSTQCAGSSPTYTCTIDNSLVGGVMAADVIDYFVIAQDTVGNVSINPGAGASATDVNTVTTPPTTPNTYTIVTPFPSTVNVPGDYPSLTNTGGVFEAMNAGTFTGNTVINITADLVGELGTVALNQLSEEGAGAGTYTVLIKPSGAPRSITGSINGALIRLNGADRVRIDGSTAATLVDKADNVVGGNPALRELTIQNTNTGTSSVIISFGSNGTNGAQNDTVKNVNILGQDPTTTLLGISLGGATPGTAATGPNNGNRVENCSVKRAIFGIYSAGTSAASQNTGTVITQNETSDVTGDRIRRVGIIVFNENGVQITENSLNGISTNESADGIGIAVGIQGMDTTTTTSGGVSNALVERNKINGVASLSATGFSAAGITVAGTTGGANIIRNNMITGVTAPATSPDLVAGIYVVGATGSVTRVYHNSVSMTGDRGAVAGQMPSFGIAVTGTNPTVELKDNIFYTTQIASGGGVDAKSYAIGMVTTTFTNLDSNYNDFWSAGANDGGFRSGSLGSAAGTDYPNLAGWQTAVSDDANSQEVDPVYVNPLNDLHLDAALTPLLGDGITGFATNDFDGETRDNPPDIGADEIVTPAPAGTVQFSSATYSVGEGGGMVTLTVTRTGGSNGAVTVNYALAGGTATGGAACTVGIDYVNTGGSVMFANGDMADKTFDVPICDDALYETPDETFNATLSIGSGGATTGTPNPATVTITGNDGVPTLQFSTATDSVGEGGGSITLTVTRTGATGNAVSVQYATASGTATSGAACTAGVDFIGASGTLNFVSGDTSETFNVTICEDVLIEGSENFTASLSMPGGGAVIGSPSTETVTITDNESDTTAPVITYTPISSDPPMTALNATITDAVGVTGATIFWSINGGSFTSAACGLSGGTPQNGTWSCTIIGTSNPNAVAYYVTATDAAMNTATNPAGGATAPNLFTIGAATVPAGTYTNMSLGNNVSLGGNVVVNDNLSLNGIVNAGANTLTLGCSATVTGGGEFSYVVGNFEKFFCGIGMFTFHVGGPFPMPPLSPEDTTLAPEGQISNYSPLTVNITAGTVGSSLTVSVTDAFMLGTVQTNSISRYWTVTENGNLTADMSYTYRNEDVNGTETSYNVLRREVGTAVYPGGTVNAATNTANAPGVTNFSQWGAGVAAPTAANVSVSGQVRAGKSLLKGVLVMISGGGLSEPRMVRTNNFGNYSFEGIPAGHTYVVQVFSGRYTFPQPSIVINVDDNVTDVDFLAEEP